MSIYEAAERLRRLENLGNGSIADRNTLVREYLRLTDPSPITPLALAARGFEADATGEPTRIIGDVTITVGCDGKMWLDGIVPLNITTIGQLDSLMRDLSY